MPGGRYGFYDRLRAEFPSQVLLDTTELCNLACVMCPHPTFKKSSHYHGRSLEPELNEKLVDEVRDHGQGITQYIRFTGSGEPLIHPRIFEMLDYAVTRSGTTVTLTTNGTLLDQKHVDRLLATGVGVVDISIDAFEDETYAQVRVHGDLKVTRANVQRLIGASKRGGSRTKVVVSYVEQEQNARETADFERFWKDQGADYVVIRRLHSNVGMNIRVADLLRRRVAAEARRPCLYPWERLILNPRGELSFCPEDWVHGSVVADYRTTTIRETWQGEFMRSLRQAHLDNSFGGHAFCGNCPDWQQTRWPDEGRSYADMVQDFREERPASS